MDTISFDMSASARMPGLSVAIASSQGNSRKENMDRAEWFKHHTGSAVCLVVADGMGGPGGGKEASHIAVTLVGQTFAEWKADDWDRCLVEAILTASEKIAERAWTDTALEDMGTTVVATVVDGDRMVVAHVGDSRAVLFRSDYVCRLTKDHLAIVEYGVTDELGRTVFVDENRAKGHPESNILSRSVGGGEPLKEKDIDVGSGILRPGDVLLLCSDGVTEYVPEDYVVDLIASKSDAARMSHAIVEHAVQGGSHDHSTALVAVVLEGA